MTPLQILEKFNSCYVEIQAIAQSAEWHELCDKSNDPEMKIHLGDVLHYLGEAMNCVEECVEVRTSNGSNTPA
ncbi:hypothetical protein A6S26_05530 [Nostoc sp. ATCC 43529]|nr:hypothetical protein A6S26_05530 [Nostoc sp. ATCC 43529]